MTTSADTDTTTFEAAWNDWHDRARTLLRRSARLGEHHRLVLAHRRIRVRRRPSGTMASRRRRGVRRGVRRDRPLEPVEGAPGLFVEDGDRRIEVIRRTGWSRCASTIRSPRISPSTTVSRSMRRANVAGPGTFTPFEHPGPSRRAPSWKVSSTISTRVGGIDFDLAGARCAMVAFGAPRRRVARPVHRRHQRRDDIPRRPVAFDPRTDTDGTVTLDFNRASQPAVRIHRLRDLPGSTRRRTARHCRRGRREDSTLSS